MCSNAVRNNFQISTTSLLFPGVQDLKKKSLSLCNLFYSFYHRNLKGESVVATILPSRMEVSYCTCGFFHS